MNLRSPLSRARGLGSAKDGVGHWWLQRLTALALIPLTLWFVFSAARYHAADYAVLLAWLRNPFAATAVVLWLIALFWHSALGVQVVIEDYVANEALRFSGVILEKFLHLALGAGAVFAVLKLALGAA
jgi:succinate dehydrogenase / fumarate reductase membrane anchor subunit